MDTGDYKKASTCYLIGNVFNKGIAFLTVPIFTRILSTSDYGIVTTYNSWIGIVTMLLGFALHMAIRSSFIDYRAKVDEYLTSTLLFTVSFSVSMLCVSFAKFTYSFYTHSSMYASVNVCSYN